MKRNIWYFALLLVLATFSGCETTEHYKENIDRIECIQIVELTGFNEAERRYEETLKREVTDIAGFIDDLCGVSYSQHFTDPIQLRAGITVIKIVYKNGNFEHIYHNAQYTYRPEGGGYGYIEYDQQQFEALIEKYTD